MMIIKIRYQKIPIYCYEFSSTIYVIQNHIKNSFLHLYDSFRNSSLALGDYFLLTSLKKINKLMRYHRAKLKNISYIGHTNSVKICYWIKICN